MCAGGECLGFSGNCFLLKWQIQSDEAWVEFFPEVNETSVPVFRETRLPLDALGLVAKTGEKGGISHT